MRKIKSYLVFTSFLYRLMMFGLIHLILLGLMIVFPFRPYTQAVFVVFFEIMSDNWLFGGICSKDAQSMNYLKSSKKGMQVLKDGLVVNLARCLLNSSLWICIGFFYTKSQNPEAFTLTTWQTVCFLGASILFTYSLCVAGITISRFFSNYWINMLISYAAMILLVLAMLFSLDATYLVFIALVLAILVSILSLRIVLKKMKESYYDK
ncbi:MAG: hypothetical protein E7256_12085 [Lachnospiraceae bacterium]|nr:hypothetical protein [Lachnospiraceae bacterium]